jgi:methionine biosynthesis protein MetW
MESKSYAALDLETLAALDPNTSYAKVREMVGSGKRVLDVGCGPGNLATILSRTGNVVVGIDKDKSALESAQRVCERTIAADLDHAELDELVGDERFDVVVFADVLEHVRNPVKLLNSSRRVLRDAGCIIVSIPNVAHGAVRLALLRGRFEYQQLGILDDTHIRFYTRESVLRLLSESGFAAVRLERTTASVFERSDLVPLVRREDYDAAVVAEILRDDDAETLQFVVRAAPVAEGQVAAVLTAEITSLQQAVRMLRAQLAQAHDAAAATLAEAAAANINGTQLGSDRLAEVEGHYRNALDLAEATRAERDEAVASAQRAMAELEELRLELERVGAELHVREEHLAAADRALAEAEGSRAELAELRANYDLAIGAMEPLRAELLRVQRLADDLAAERDSVLARTAAAEDELERATAEAAESHENLRAARALLAEVERELQDVRNDAAALRAERDAAAVPPNAALSEPNALLRRATDLESLLAVERTSREHVEESADRILAVAREREARASASELRRLLAYSAVVDMELRLAATVRRRIPLPAVPPPTAMPPALVLRAATVGRRSLTVLPPRPGRRERLRARWRRLRRLLPLVLLLSLLAGSSA